MITSRRMGLREFVNVNYLAHIIDVANCAAPDSVFNTGVPPCDLKKKKIIGIIFCDKGVSFSQSDCASAAAFIAAVKTKTTAARGGRVYPVWDLLNFEDNTGDPATGSVGNLTTATQVTSDAVPAFSFGYNGTEARHKRMAAMAGMSLDILLVDEGWAVYGTADGDNIAGFSVLQPYADASKFPVSDSVNQYRFRVTLGSIVEYRDQSRFVVANSGLSAAVGLVNVNLSKLSSASNVWKIKMIADGGTDMEPLYGADLDGLTWTATNLETGDDVTITSVATDAALDAMTVTFDSTEYTAMTDGDRIQLNGPSAIDMAGVSVKPYEMISVILEKAA